MREESAIALYLSQPTLTQGDTYPITANYAHATALSAMREESAIALRMRLEAEAERRTWRAPGAVDQEKFYSTLLNFHTPHLSPSLPTSISSPSIALSTAVVTGSESPRAHPHRAHQHDFSTGDCNSRRSSSAGGSSSVNGGGGGGARVTRSVSGTWLPNSPSPKTPITSSPVVARRHRRSTSDVQDIAKRLITPTNDSSKRRTDSFLKIGELPYPSAAGSPRSSRSSSTPADVSTNNTRSPQKSHHVAPSSVHIDAFPWLSSR
eukprot:TRINITY_DN729_c0_g1_i1.p2 TRINITY_DN729_c0_g1~~TRINITY_DN729_c0_g1_i1.p2  ORF type:complete len:264 (+),score=51.91 TRINITY_DN729_c0_g1_i1:988-1779(+)